MSLRSARFSFSPALEPYSPLKARPLPVTGCTPATSRKRREDTRRFGAKGTAKGQVNKYSTSQLQRAWDATAAYKGTAACKLGNTLLNRGSDVSQLVKPWERVDVWRGWLLTDAAMHGNDGFGSNGGTRATTPGGRGKISGTSRSSRSDAGPQERKRRDPKPRAATTRGTLTDLEGGTEEQTSPVDSSSSSGGSTNSHDPSDGGGQLNKMQFITAVRALLGASALAKQEASDLFGILDQNSSGTVSLATAASGMKRLADDAARTVASSASGDLDLLALAELDSMEKERKAAEEEEEKRRAAEEEKRREEKAARDASKLKEMQEAARKQRELEESLRAAAQEAVAEDETQMSEHAKRSGYENHPSSSGSRNFKDVEEVRAWFMAPIGPKSDDHVRF